MATERIYLYNQLVYDGPDALGFDGADYLSTAFFCRHCGDVWGRIIRPSSRDIFWNLEFRSCEKHDGGHLTDLQYCDGARRFPRPLLEREFLIQTQFVDRVLHERKR